MSDKPKAFVEAFRKVIATIDPQANSLMSKDMPPAVKILADWGRKACDKLAASEKREKGLLDALVEVTKYSAASDIKRIVDRAIKENKP